MTEGKITLSGFKLEEAEKAIVDNLIRSYKDKISEKIKFDEVRLRMKKSARGKTFLHEVQGVMMPGRFNAKVTDYNLFSALSGVLEKLTHEAEHNKRFNRQK